jgi:hypothetical protein
MASKQVADDCQVKLGVVEEYRVNGQHFTRSLLVPPQGGWCQDLFAIDGEEIANEATWHALLHVAYQTRR